MFHTAGLSVRKLVCMLRSVIRNWTRLIATCCVPWYWWAQAAFQSCVCAPRRMRVLSAHWPSSISALKLATSIIKQASAKSLHLTCSLQIWSNPHINTNDMDSITVDAVPGDAGQSLVCSIWSSSRRLRGKSDSPLRSWCDCESTPEGTVNNC